MVAFRILKGIGFFLAVTALSFGVGYLAVSIDIGGERVEVPNIMGMEVKGALQVLRDLGLEGRQAGEEYNREIPKGAVVEQRPRAGYRLRKGGVVRYILSKGTDEVVIPDLVGNPISKARRYLQENGLTLGRVVSVYSEAFPKDSIIAQYPPSETKGKRGDTVDLLVSLGPEEVYYIMPDLVGKEQVLVQRFLQALGFQVKVELVEKPPEKKAGFVLAQEPANGSRARAGSQVKIYVGQ